MKHLSEVELVMALDGEMEPDELQRAVEHLAECDECRDQWEKLQATSAMVVEYQKTLYPATAKPLAADERGLKLIENKSWFSGWQWRFAAVAAMVMIAVGVSWLTRPVGPQPDSSTPISHLGPPDHVTDQKQVPLSASGSVRNDNSERMAQREKGAGHKSGAKKPASPTKQDLAKNQYTELPFSDSSLPLDDATVVRVSMPASVLRQAGVAVSEDNATAMLQADVVLGMDGLPRGIRLVQNQVANRAGTN